jgi:hypothetical protein
VDCDADAAGKDSFLGGGGAGACTGVGGTIAVEPLLARSFSEGGFDCREMDLYIIFVGLSMEFLRRGSYEDGSLTMRLLA